MRKIYDCFNFFNELDLLEIRLNTLNDVVDYFVIVEADVTHSGLNKPFYYENNIDRFAKFKDKIINFKIFDTPSIFTNLVNSSTDVELNKIYHYINTQTNSFDRNTQQHFGRDFFQKESVRRALVDCNDEDVIIYSDLDEFPNPEIIKNVDKLDLSKIYRLNQNMYCYYLNVFKEPNWFGSRILNYNTVKNMSLNEVRNNNNLSIELKNGGWHFSFTGGEEMVKKKIMSYSHQEFNNNNVLSSIENKINNNIDPYSRGNLMTVEIDETYPEYLINNMDKYKHLIK